MLQIDGNPFERVAISTDSHIQDLLGYERIISRTVPMMRRFVQLWSGESGNKDNLGKPPNGRPRGQNRQDSCPLIQAAPRPRHGTRLLICFD